MRPTDSIQRFIDTAAVRTNPKLDETILNKVLAAQEEATSEDSAALRPGRRSIIMRKPVVKWAAAAALIAVVGLGMLELFGTGKKSGVVWAEVVRKVEANRGFMYRERIRIARSDRAEQVAYVVAYDAGPRRREDYSLQPDGQIFRSQYSDLDAKTATYVYHDEKKYLHLPISERTQLLRESGCLNPRDWVRQFLSREYKKLGRRTIEGVLCEGIGTTDPTFGGGDPLPTSSVARLWISAETGYPVRLEYSSAQDGEKKAQAEFLWERFQWDMELSPSLFEPNIPSDYKRLQGSL